MHVEQADLTDAGTLRACHEAYLAAQRIDAPEGPWFRQRTFGRWLTVGWDSEPREVWIVPGQAQGSVAAWYLLELPKWENPDRGFLELTVHPAARRRGIGRALLRHTASRMAGHGRSQLVGTARKGSPGEAFARAAGAEPGLVDIQRVMELSQLTADKLARLREPAERAAAGYSLVSWPGPVPEELIEQAAALYAALNDAPHNPGFTPSVWDAQQVRERINENRGRYGRHEYAVAARHDISGELAALTEIAVDPADPGWGHQMITAVTRKHRGHRLGLLVKLAMLDLLATEEPRLERIVTWNSQANEHMIAVNEDLGYTILGQPSTWYRTDAAALLGR